jgi:succinate dehydrogenase cytochrome b subunit
MNRTASTLRSTIGAKALMAVTGLLLMLFVLGHMIGNLQIFGPPEKINQYAHFLQSLGGVLWGIRLGLLAIFVLHIWAAVIVSRASRTARPIEYEYKRVDLATSYAARTMLMSGVIVALFVVYHILHFTTGTIDLAGSYGHTVLLDGEQVPNVHKMVIDGFKHVPTAITYILANLLLAIHLSHGAASLLQTLGFRGQANASKVKKFGLAFGLIIGIGNVAMPLSIMLGLVG